MKQRLGDNFLNIPKALGVTLHIIFRGGRYHNSTIRALLREHGVVQRDEVITGMMIQNLKHRLSCLDPEHTKWKEVNFSVPKEFDTETCSKEHIEQYAMEYLRDQMNEDGGASVLELLSNLKSSFPGFDYRIARSSKNELTAWMFMTPE